MASRPVGTTEEPEYGSIWSWEKDGNLLMAVAPDPEHTLYGRWQFVRLNGHPLYVGKVTILNWMQHATGETLMNWWRHD